jgi:hypothetical protein
MAAVLASTSRPLIGGWAPVEHSSTRRLRLGQNRVRVMQRERRPVRLHVARSGPVAAAGGEAGTRGSGVA